MDPTTLIVILSVDAGILVSEFAAGTKVAAILGVSALTFFVARQLERLPQTPACSMLQLAFPCLVLGVGMFQLGRSTASTIMAVALSAFVVLICFYLLQWLGVRHRRAARPIAVFTAQDNAVSMFDGASTQTRPMDAIRAVSVETTDQGPYACDAFLNLLFADGTTWAIPMENPGYQSIYDALSEVLPLDHEQTILAMGSADNALFTLWMDEKSTSGQNQQGVKTFRAVTSIGQFSGPLSLCLPWGPSLRPGVDSYAIPSSVLLTGVVSEARLKPCTGYRMTLGGNRASCRPRHHLRRADSRSAQEERGAV